MSTNTDVQARSTRAVDVGAVATTVGHGAGWLTPLSGEHRIRLYLLGGQGVVSNAFVLSKIE
jgi:hypothetical protein